MIARPAARTVAGLVLAALLCCSLAGCQTDLDRDQARLCRLAAVGVIGEDEGITIIKQTVIPASGVAPSSALPLPGGDTAIRTLLSRATPRNFGRTESIDCLFGAGEHRLSLIAVRTEWGLVSLPRLFALTRFWLNSPDAAARDPAPVGNLGDAVALPSHSGYAIQQAVNAIPAAVVYALLAVAYALVYGLIGRINLAFGAFAAIGGTATLIAVLAMGRWGVAVALGAAALAALLPSALHGAVAARLVFRPLHRATGQQSLVATLGLALVLGEYLRLAQGPESRWIGPLFDTPFALARDETFVVTLTPITVLVTSLAAAAAVGLTLAMRLTTFGRNWRAYRDDPLAAALFGVGRDRIVGQTFALASAFAGLAGGITVVVFGDISFAYAQGLGLKALTAAVLGGIGSVSGAFYGGLFIGFVEYGWSAAFPIVNRDLVTFCILVATLIWRPGGFLGDRDLLPRRV